MSAFKIFAREAACRYLQSAVFIDDKIFDQRTGMPVDKVDLPRARKPVFVPESGETVAPPVAGQTTPESTTGDQPYHPKELVSSFAREGIICALYEPAKEFSTAPDSEIFKLCQRPDIIILDWDFSGDNGERALNLIAALVKQSHEQLPHHLRLLSVYTLDPSLVAVANKIADRLTEDGFGIQPEKSQCRLRSGATRLLILGKNIQRFGADEESFTVKEADLANRLIDEFTDMNTGLLPSYVLHGMAAIRQSSKRILERFHGGMDGAFLLHRAFSIESEEAFDQLPALLAEELLAVLEDERIAPDVVSGLVNSAVEDIAFKPPLKDWRYVNGQPLTATHLRAGEVLKTLLLTGKLNREAHQGIREIADLPKEGFRGIHADLMKDFLGMVDTHNTSANERLADIFVTRTQYDSKKRELLYGAVIRHRSKGSATLPWFYSFCLMPICDCLRLNQTRQHERGEPIRFPFWKLKEDVFSGSSASRRGISLVLPDGKYICLSAGGKPRDMLWLASFSVDATTGTVAASVNTNGRFVFNNGENLQIEWLAQLKPLHAQRIALDIGQSLSRVGLVEAEWLRLLCDR